jgi:hypothetical protein
MKENIKSYLIIILFFICIFLIVNQNYEINILKKNETINSSNTINGVKINDIVLKVEVASSNIERAKGLSDRESLSADTGMLFVFNNSGKYSFWMKDMNFPIDIIWIDENSKIVFIEKDAKPESYPALLGGLVDSKYVLETVSGFTSKNNIKIGDTVNFLSQ